MIAETVNNPTGPSASRMVSCMSSILTQLAVLILEGALS